MNATEPSLVDRPLHKLDRRVQTILLHHEQPNVIVLACADQCVCAFERDRHRLLTHHVLARECGFDPERRVKPGRRSDGHYVTIHSSKHRRKGCEPGHAVLQCRSLGALRHNVRNADKVESVDTADRVEMVPAYPAAADKCQPKVLRHGRSGRRDSRTACRTLHIRERRRREVSRRTHRPNRRDARERQPSVRTAPRSSIPLRQLR